MGYAVKRNGREWRMVVSVDDLLPGEEYSESEPIKPPPTVGELVAELEAALDAHIDSVARAKGYDSRITAALRAGYVNPWQAEGVAFGQWMDACYAKALAIQKEVEDGQRPIPTAEELIAEMPVMVWPE